MVGWSLKLSSAACNHLDVGIPDKCKVGPNLSGERLAGCYPQRGRGASTSREACSGALI
jgi:hypothetical protein